MPPEISLNGPFLNIFGPKSRYFQTFTEKDPTAAPCPHPISRPKLRAYQSHSLVSETLGDLSSSQELACPPPISRPKLRAYQSHSLVSETQGTSAAVRNQHSHPLFPGQNSEHINHTAQCQRPRGPQQQLGTSIPTPYTGRQQVYFHVHTGLSEDVQSSDGLILTELTSNICHVYWIQGGRGL